jgi:hypothetical protein
MSEGGELTIVGAGDDAPIAFVGPPAALAGELTVANRGDKKRWFRGGAVNVGATSILAAPILPVGIEPGRSLRVPLHAKLDAATPAGVLHGTISLADAQVAAVLHVTEHVALDVSPDPLVLEASPGARVEKQVTLRNRGNVALALDAARPVVLQPEAPPERVIAGIVDALRAGEDAKPVTAATAAPELVARITAAAVALAPAQVATIAIAIELPSTLALGTRYVGRVPLYTADLSLVVVTTEPGGLR